MSCLAPPPVPRFGRRNASDYVVWQNYASTWFTLDWNNDTSNVVTRASRKKLYQPWMTYDASQLTENALSMFASDHLSHFNDVYEIRLNGSSESYTCPIGWVFENSKNISHTVTCLDWEWRADFNITSPCVRKYPRLNYFSN